MDTTTIGLFERSGDPLRCGVGSGLCWTALGVQVFRAIPKGLRFEFETRSRCGKRANPFANSIRLALPIRSANRGLDGRFPLEVGQSNGR